MIAVDDGVITHRQGSRREPHGRALLYGEYIVLCKHCKDSARTAQNSAAAQRGGPVLRPWSRRSGLLSVARGTHDGGLSAKKWCGLDAARPPSPAAGAREPVRVCAPASNPPAQRSNVVPAARQRRSCRGVISDGVTVAGRQEHSLTASPSSTMMMPGSPCANGSDVSCTRPRRVHQAASSAGAMKCQGPCDCQLMHAPRGPSTAQRLSCAVRWQPYR